MTELEQSDKDFLKHLASGGLVGIAIYGKKTTTIEVVSNPSCWFAGIRHIERLREAGFVRSGDPSPYKGGRITPVILTEVGKSALVGALL